MQQSTEIKNQVPYQRNSLWVLWIGGFLVIFSFFQWDNVQLDFQMMLGLVLAPFIFRRGGEAGHSRRYFWLALLFFVALFFRRSGSLYFFALAFSILFVVEQYWAKLNMLPFFWCLIISPLFRQFSNIWTFPIRLEMSSLAARILSGMGFEAYAEGNIIQFEGTGFAVDPACMGLNLIITALLLGLVILAHFERRHKKQFGFVFICFALALVFLLTVLANFSRLLTLVLFRIFPDHPLHDVIGLLSLLVYVVVPLYFLIGKIGKIALPAFGRWSFAVGDTVVLAKEGKIGSIEGIAGNSGTGGWFGLLPVLLILCLVGTGRQFRAEWIQSDPDFESIRPEGFERSITDNGVLKLENEDLLIYIKAPAGAFQGSHDPRYCWSGSGYEMSKVQKDTISGLELYLAEMQKAEDLLFTAWWFDGGSVRTIREWEWRWHTLQNDTGFRLINVTANDIATLRSSVQKMLNQPLLSAQ